MISFIRLFAIVFIITACGGGSSSDSGSSSSSSSGSATTPACGNDSVEAGEACDRNDLNGYNCSTFAAGFTTGTLSCKSDCSGYDYSQCTRNTNIIPAVGCEQADVQNAINSANDGDTVLVPAGSCNWSTENVVRIDKQIILRGSGINTTIITASGTSYQAALSIADANIVVREFSFISQDGSFAYPIQATSEASNFRISNNDFSGTSGYAIDVRGAYGVIDHNSITFTIGSSQPINVWGRSDSWQTPSTIGGAENVFLEDNIFTPENLGYPVCSTNARCVFRYNTIGKAQIDMHGTCTGNPGARHYEIYNNEWIDHDGYYMAFDIRGGTGRIFNNTATKTGGALWFNLDEHAANHLYCAGYAPDCCCTPPCDEQIGVGMDPKQRASEPLYIWGNTMNGDYWPASIKTDVALCATADKCGVDFSMSTILTSGTDFFNSETKPEAMANYVPYPYPHPLVQVEDQ